VIKGTGLTQFQQVILPQSAPPCNCGLRVLYLWGLDLPVLAEWAVALKHSKQSLLLLARGSCAGSSMSGDYAFSDTATQSIADVCVPGQVVPPGTYKPAAGSVASAFSCANPPGANHGV
jgi:hypothetical protein